MNLKKQILVLLSIVMIFGLFNFSLYSLLTQRLSNNFSSATQAQMIDVGQYLPFKQSSDLTRINSSLKLYDDLPILDGAAALVPVYASIIDNIYPNDCVTFDGGEFSSDNYYGENFAYDSAMQYNNTIRGYEAVVDGKTDLFFSAAPSKEQIDYAQSQGVELEYVPIGLEAFVFFVNENNPVNNLTVEQIRKIYCGEYKNWKDVKGANRIINPLTRLKGSGSQTTFESFMGDYKIARKHLFALVGGSIGFSFRYYMNGIVSNDHVKLLAINGVEPTSENIQNNQYPIVAKFYAVYRKDNNNKNIPVLINWLLSDEGQTLIEKTGYVRIK